MNFTDKKNCMSRGAIIAFHVLSGMVMIAVFGLLFGYFVMLLWNNLMPDIFGLKQITFWQGTGLVIISRLLIGSHGYNRHAHPGKSFSHGSGHSFCGNDNSHDYYHQWWEEEGKLAFKQYIGNVQAEADD